MKAVPGGLSRWSRGRIGRTVFLRRILFFFSTHSRIGDRRSDNTIVFCQNVDGVYSPVAAAPERGVTCLLLTLCIFGRSEQYRDLLSLR